MYFPGSTYLSPRMCRTACSQLSDFQQTAGSFAVTARPDIAVDYVVTPGEDVSIEVTKDKKE